MELIQAIEERRSIRTFRAEKVPRETIEQLLTLATKAPSGKNRQPWRFVVVQGKRKNELVELMKRAQAKCLEQNKAMGSLAISTNAIDEAAAVMLLFNAFSRREDDYNHYRLLTDTQSIGAAVQTLLLAAQQFELGGLWICDVFYCERDICAWLNKQDELVAAVAIGYPNQQPYARPRKALAEVVDWIE